MSTAVEMGIKIGTQVVKEDWYRFEKHGLEGEGGITIRENLITRSAGVDKDVEAKFFACECKMDCAE